MYNVCARACMRACTYMRTCVHACVCALTPQHILILCRLQSPQVCCNLCKRSGTFISRDCYFFMSVKEPRFLCLSLEIPYPHIQTCTKHTYTQIHTHLHIHTNRCHDTLHGAPAYAVPLPPPAMPPPSAAAPAQPSSKRLRVLPLFLTFACTLIYYALIPSQMHT